MSQTQTSSQEMLARTQDSLMRSQESPMRTQETPARSQVSSQESTQESAQASPQASPRGSDEQPATNFVPSEFIEFGKKRVEALMEMQKEFFETFQEINQAWLARARFEASLNSELVARLTAARTVPETADACQDCMDKRVELLVEDSRRLLADSQKIMSLSTRFLTNGSAGDGSTS